MAHPPMSASLRFNSNPDFLHSTAKTSLVASVISGPIPSPGRRVTSYESLRDTALSDDDDDDENDDNDDGEKELGVNADAT